MLPSYLLRSQLNELYGLIKELSEKTTPSMFKWEPIGVVDGPETYQLVHKQSRFYFWIASGSSYFDVEYSPGYSTSVSAMSDLHWDHVRKRFIDWIKNLDREVDQPNLWELLRNELPQANLDIDRDERFNADELRQVDDSIDQVVNAIEQPEQFQYLSSEDRTFLTSQFEELKVAARSSTKRSWVQLLVGVSVTVVLTLGSSSTLASDLFTVVQNAFNWVTATGVPLLLP